MQSEELKDVEIGLINDAQKGTFSDRNNVIRYGKELHSKSKLVCLKPYLDNDGLLHCNNWLTNA